MWDTVVIFHLYILIQLQLQTRRFNKKRSKPVEADPTKSVLSLDDGVLNILASYFSKDFYDIKQCTSILQFI